MARLDASGRDFPGREIRLALISISGVGGRMEILHSVVLCIGLFGGMLVLLEAGFRAGRSYRAAQGGESTGIFDTAIFALLGLLLGFAFSGAVDRLNMRRDMIVQEANAIGTAYLRVDLLAPEDQAPIRDLFHAYLADRVEAYRALDRGGDPGAVFGAAEAAQGDIWRATIEAVSRPEAQYAAEVVVPAVNEMIDITTTRKVALGTHIPELVLVLLFGVSLLSAFLAGAAMAKHAERRLIHGAIFAAAVSLTIYTILDLDSPRGGLIRLDGADAILQDLQQTI